MLCSPPAHGWRALEPRQLLQALCDSPPHALPRALAFIVDVVAGRPLTAAEWQLVPSPCAGLATSLSAVLERSPAEVVLLVARLPEPERRRLRTTALALHRECPGGGGCCAAAAAGAAHAGGLPGLTPHATMNTFVNYQSKSKEKGGE